MHHLLRICVTLLQEPVVQLLADRFALVVQLIYVPRPSMGYAHNGPKGLCLALSLVRLILCITHLLCVIVENLFRKRQPMSTGMPPC